RLSMLLHGINLDDRGAQIRKVIDHTEAVDLQANVTAVLGLQEDRRRKFAGDRRLADTFRAVDQDSRRQLCGELVNIGEVHLTSSHLSWPKMRSSATPSGPRALPSASRQSPRRTTSGSVPCCRASEHTMALSAAAVSASLSHLWLAKKISARPPSGNRPTVQVYRSPPACRSNVSAARRFGRRSWEVIRRLPRIAHAESRSPTHPA